MKFIGTFKVIDYDHRKYVKELDKAMVVEIKHAARAWLRAMLTAPLPTKMGGASVGIPPVYTGTARGTLLPLGRILREHIPIQPIAKRKGRDQYYGSSHGQVFLPEPGRGTGSYRFRFSTDLLYYISNEFDPSGLKTLTHKTPWEGFKVGQRAFQEYAEKVLPTKLPKVIDFIRYTTRIIR